MLNRTFRFCAIGLLVSSAGLATAIAAPDAAAPPGTHARLSDTEITAITATVNNAIVQIEVTPQYDKGEPPAGDSRMGWSSRWRFADGGMPGVPDDFNWVTLTAQERPAVLTGYLVSPTRVYAETIDLHPRFIKSLKVRFKDQVVEARPGAWAKSRRGYFIDLAQPLAGATPLKFEPQKPGPYFAVTAGRFDTQWVTTVSPMGGSANTWEDGRRTTSSAIFGVAVDRTGAAVGLLDGTDLPADGSWRSAPDAWDLIEAPAMDAMLKGLDATSDSSIVRIMINFRSPRSDDASDGSGFRYRSPFAMSFGGRGDEDESSTEVNTLGVVLDNRTVLVLASFGAKRTARLERVRVFWPDGNSTPASFSGSLRDWNAFVATLEAPAPSAPAISSEPVLSFRNDLLLRAAVTMHEDTRVAYLDQDRVMGLARSHKDTVLPILPMYSGSSSWESGTYSNFYFTTDMSLFALPLTRRQKIVASGRDSGWSYYAAEASIPAALVRAEIARGGDAFDTDNRPLSEAEENRIAWLGVELQGMTPDLARANQCLKQTKGGRIGGFITHIYEGSPAAAAGLKDGDILLRLHIDKQPKPLEVVAEDGGMGGMMDEYWAMLESMPSEYFDQLPQPWGSAETFITMALTEVGFGTRFEVELLRNGETVRVPMTVTQGPAHFNSAPRLKSEELGATTRDLTYEVRRYFQIPASEGGIIVSKVESGSKAAVAGLRPMEIITSVNDAPVANVKEFEAAIKAGGEFKLSVKRMNKGRIVKVNIDPAGTGPSAPAQAPADGMPGLPGMPRLPGMPGRP
ncbi:MAG: PDZ domain-containing protein [Phycisphaerales bacterium]|jgi:hypothetical protein|nr:PDZ domain-containing protein [Phycisphaeraceae bacterium]